MAGYPEIDDVFGFKAQLYGLSNGDITKERLILDLSVYEVYTQIQIKSHYAEAQREQMRLEKEMNK
jgi:hypothetical protein